MGKSPLDGEEFLYQYITCLQDVIRVMWRLDLVSLKPMTAAYTELCDKEKRLAPRFRGPGLW